LAEEEAQAKMVLAPSPGKERQTVVPPCTKELRQLSAAGNNPPLKLRGARGVMKTVTDADQDSKRMSENNPFYPSYIKGEGILSLDEKR
jgi:hypothetical protein